MSSLPAAYYRENGQEGFEEFARARLRAAAQEVRRYIRGNPINALFFRLQHRYAPYLFVAPFVILFLTFTLYPIAKSLSLSFYITNGPKSQVFVGWDNFRFLWGDPAFHRAVWNTCTYALTSVFLQLPLGAGLALLLNSRLVKGRNFFVLVSFHPIWWVRSLWPCCSPSFSFPSLACSIGCCTRSLARLSIPSGWVIQNWLCRLWC